MQYMVTGLDGKEYGPTDVETLKTWVTENRLAPHTMLRDFNSGQTLSASQVPGLFAEAARPNVPPVGAPYPRAATGYSSTATIDEGGGAFAGVVLRAVGGVLLFFVLHGIGLLVAGSGLITAFQLQSRGSKFGIPAIAVAGIAVVAIGIGWALRLSGTHA